MRSRRALLLPVAAGAAGLGCGALHAFDLSRGTLDVVSSRPNPRQIAVEYSPRVEGRACFTPFETGKDGIALAVADALAKRPEANALALMTLRAEKGQCFVVEGTPVRLR
jgi:hypothetical protein